MGGVISSSILRISWIDVKAGGAPGVGACGVSDTGIVSFSIGFFHDEASKCMGAVVLFRIHIPGRY